MSSPRTLSPQRRVASSPRRTLSPLRTSSPLRATTISINTKSSPLRTTTTTPLKPYHHHHVLASSTRQNLPVHHEIFSRHDLLIKQMDRQRGEMFQRIHERVQRAKNITQQCSDQIHQLTSQIASMERYYKQEKINESRDYHFKQNILLSVEEDPLDDNLLRGDDDFEQSLYTSKSSIIHTTTNTMFGDSDEDL